MTSRSSGAVYIGQETSLGSAVSKRLVALVMGAFAFALMAMAGAMVIPSQTPAPAAPSASAAGFCKFGSGMEGPGGWSSGDDYPGGGSSRYLTAEEALGSNVGFTKYYGEGAEPFIDKIPANRATPYISADNKTKIEDSRGFFSCVSGVTGVTVANFTLGFASVVTDLTTTFSVYAFKADLICDSPNSTGSCINLLRVIGGTQDGVSNDGIIGALTQSIYIPLLVLVVLATAAWIVWTAIVKRKLREAFFGALWLFVSAILGLTLLLRPAMLVAGPMKISNVLAGCVISAFSGGNCVTGNSSGAGPDTTQSSSQVCYADGGTASERVEIVAASLSCSVWKAFVLEPYAQGSFGQSFEALDTGRSSPGGSVVKQAIADSEKYSGTNNLFCISLRSQGGVNSMVDGTLQLNGPGSGKKICNIALYQLFLKTQATHEGPDGRPEIANGVDTRWYSIVDVAASDDQMWESWMGSGSKIANGSLALLAALMGGGLIMLVALLAMVYYISSVVLMAFAPLFFLFGVHPGKGRDMLKGFGEMVISNILKYLASAIFLIITLALYGAVLGASQSTILSLLFVLILTFALAIYRKEIINLIGRVNMGGEKLSSSFTDKLSSQGKKVGTTGLIAAGTAAGSMAKATADGGIRESLKNPGGILAAGAQGAATGATRELRKPGGPLGKVGSGAFRGFDAYNGQLNKNTKSEAAAAQNVRDEANRKLNSPHSAYADLNESASLLDASVDRESNLAAALPEAESRVSATSPESLKVMIESMNGGSNFVAALDAEERALALQPELAQAREAGDTDRVVRIEGEINANMASSASAIDSLGEDQFKTLNETYTSGVVEHEKAVDNFNVTHASYLDQKNGNDIRRADNEGKITQLKEDTAVSARAEVTEKAYADWHKENGAGATMHKGARENLDKAIVEQGDAAVAIRHAEIDARFAASRVKEASATFSGGHGEAEIKGAQVLEAEARVVREKRNELDHSRKVAETSFADATKEAKAAREALNVATGEARRVAEATLRTAQENARKAEAAHAEIQAKIQRSDEYMSKRNSGSQRLRAAANIVAPPRARLNGPKPRPSGDMPLPGLDGF